NRALLQLDHQTGSDPIGRLVADLGDAREALALHELFDLRNDTLDRNLVRELGDHDGSAALADLLHIPDGAELHTAASGAECLPDAGTADQVAAGREV